MTGDRSLVDEAEGVGISGVKFSYLAGVVRFGKIHAISALFLLLLLLFYQMGDGGWRDKTQQENVARRLTPKKKFRLPK